MKLPRFRIVLLLLVVFASPSQAQDYFRIGTGGLAGVYHPVGVLLSKAISRDGDIASLALPSGGSLSNVIGVGERSIESGLVQADIAAAAYRGDGVFKGKPRIEDLRLIANLFPERIHLVVAKRSGIRSVHEIRGKRISLDEIGSGTLVVARQILKAYGISDKDVLAEYIKPGQAAERLAAGTLDGFFVIAGTPVSCIKRLADNGGEMALVPIDGVGAENFLVENPLFFRDTIAATVYNGLRETKTLSVNAQWVVHKAADEGLVYRIVKVLHSRRARSALAQQVLMANGGAATVGGDGIPLHAGAVRYYAETGGGR